MNDEKASPPSYPQPSQPQMAYASPAQSPPVQGYPGPSGYVPPPGPPHHSPGLGPIGPQAGYPPTVAPAPVTSAGAQYQQQLFAMCAQGNHDVTTKYGIAGIITAVVCFPCGLLALLCDQEKRCVRCGSRVA